MKTTLIITLIFISLFLWFKAISDISTTKFKSDKNNKIWFLTVFFIPILGAIVYFMMKKKYIVTKKPKLRAH
jgi:uncharacterized membrane protein